MRQFLLMILKVLLFPQVRQKCIMFLLNHRKGRRMDFISGCWMQDTNRHWSCTQVIYKKLFLHLCPRLALCLFILKTEALSIATISEADHKQVNTHSLEQKEYNKGGFAFSVKRMIATLAKKFAHSLVYISRF